MTHPVTYTATITIELVDPRTFEVVDTTVDVVENLTEAEAAHVRRVQVESWRHLGYTVREGSGWDTAAAIDVMASVRVDREVR